MIKNLLKPPNSLRSETSTFALIKTIIMFHYRSPMSRANISGKKMEAHKSNVFIEDIEEVRHHIGVTGGGKFLQSLREWSILRSAAGRI